MDAVGSSPLMEYKWLVKDERLLAKVFSVWDGKKGELFLTTKRIIWKCNNLSQLSADIVIPLLDVTGFRKNPQQVADGDATKADSLLCLLQVNTCRAGLITFEILLDPTSGQPSFDSRDKFLEAAARAAADSKIASTPTVSVELPRPTAASISSKNSATSSSASNFDSTTPPSLQSVRLDSPMLPTVRHERLSVEAQTSTARMDPSYSERARNEQQNINGAALSLTKQKHQQPPPLSPHKPLVHVESMLSPTSAGSQNGIGGASSSSMMTASSILSRLEVELDSLEKVIEVRVHSPQQLQQMSNTSNSNASQTHIVYAVTTKYQSTDKRNPVREGTVFHRYNDFHKLNTDLQSRSSRQSIVMPSFPPKSWIQYYDQAVLEERSRKLNDYFQQLMKTPLLLRHPMCSRAILLFLTQGERVIDSCDETSNGAGNPTYLRQMLEKGDYYISNAWAGREPTAQEDYEALQARLRQWNIPQRVFPWRKRVISLFGTTSAGKSSMVNHLFTLSCARSGGSQIDTTFTLIETVPPDVFLTHTREREFPDFSELDLLTPLPLNIDEVKIDKRYGRVFVYDERDAMKRYGDYFTEHKELLNSYSKLRSVLINERYLRGTRSEKDLATRIIVIDSKGVDFNPSKELVDNFSQRTEKEMAALSTEIRVMQLFIKISDSVCFLVPHSEVHNCAPQMALFELSLICSIDSKFYTERVREISEQNSAAPRQGFLRDIIDTILEQPIGLAKHLVSYLQPVRPPEDVVLGNERWNKVRFVITKVDELARSQNATFFENTSNHNGLMTNNDVTNAALMQEHMQLYFSVGRMFGRALRYLEPPTFGSILFVGLPEKQPNGVKKHVGALESWKSSVLAQCQEETYERRLDESIAQMCDQLQKAVSSVGMVNAMNPMRWLWSDEQLVQGARKRIQRRQQTRV